VPQNATVDVGDDGTVTATVAGQKPQQIGRIKMVTPETSMTRGTDGLFRGDNGDLAADPAARLQSGALEGSNVSPVETMVEMIAAARQFEHQMKMLENAEKQDQQASKLLSENG
jgi:flagellar basal-body rod protein FlgF